MPQTYMRAGRSYTDITGDKRVEHISKAHFHISQNFRFVHGNSKKAPISFVMYVRLFVRVYQRGSHWTNFREIWYW